MIPPCSVDSDPDHSVPSSPHPTSALHPSPTLHAPSPLNSFWPVHRLVLPGTSSIPHPCAWRSLTHSPLRTGTKPTPARSFPGPALPARATRAPRVSSMDGSITLEKNACQRSGPTRDPALFLRPRMSFLRQRSSGLPRPLLHLSCSSSNLRATSLPTGALLLRAQPLPPRVFVGFVHLHYLQRTAGAT